MRIEGLEVMRADAERVDRWRVERIHSSGALVWLADRLQLQLLR